VRAYTRSSTNLHTNYRHLSRATDTVYAGVTVHAHSRGAIKGKREQAASSPSRGLREAAVYQYTTRPFHSSLSLPPPPENDGVVLPGVVNGRPRPFFSPFWNSRLGQYTHACPPFQLALSREYARGKRTGREALDEGNDGDIVAADSRGGFARFIYGPSSCVAGPRPLHTRPREDSSENCISVA